MITDEEAERRQRKADAARRRRVIWRRVLTALAALLPGAWFLVATGYVNF
ncbi:MAG: hypothetical protein U9O18_02665 [Chloroflexota bacterium]|nr:hypothetical protein [Chloroflexota bacterium]